MTKRPRVRGQAVVAGLLCGALQGACHSDDATAATEFSAAPAATSGDFRRPSDAVPNADGTVFYFTANGGGDSEDAGVFSVPALGGTVTPLATGAPLMSPFSIAISRDDGTLYVADPASQGASDEPGQIFSLPAGGGTPASVTGTLGLRPRSVHVKFGEEGAADDLYFSGVDADGAPGLFKVAAAGGAVTPIAKGDPFGDPTGVVVTKSGDAYVVDSSSDDHGTARVIQVKGGVATELVSGLGVGFPAGVALPMDESAVLVSGIDPITGFAIVYAIDLKTQNVSTFNKGIENNVNSAGLHRARDKNVFSWADSTAGEASTGIVFRVELK